MTIERASGVCGARVSYGHDEPACGAASGIERRPGGSPSDVTAAMLAQASPTNLIYALQVFSREAQKHMGEAAILNKQREVETARHQIQEAVERAQHEAEKKGHWGKLVGTLTTIAKVAAVVAAAASVVASGGLTGPAILGLAGTLMSLGAKKVNELAGGNKTSEMFLTYGGAALSLGAGGWGLASASKTGAEAASTTATVARGVRSAATGVGGAATAASGYATYKAGKHEAGERLARADETDARAQQRAMLRQVDQLIELLQEADKSFTRAKTSLVNALESKAASDLTLATIGVKG